MLKFVRRLLALVTGLGLTMFGTGLGGLFFAPGVNTTLAIAMVVVGVLFVIVAFVFDTVVDYMDDKGS